MKFSTSKSELQQALQKLSKATPTRSTLPILSCVLITATNEKTSLRTTDLELTIDLEISVSIEEEGSAAIPLKQLYDITNELSETRITIVADIKNKSLSYPTFKGVTGHLKLGKLKIKNLDLPQFKQPVTPLKVQYDKFLFS